jgi:nitrilase
MMKESTSIKVAVVQAAPVLFEREASTEKACQLIRECGQNGAQVVLLPEAFIPAYPRGFSFGMRVGSRDPEGRLLWQRYWENSVDLRSQTTHALGAAARQAGVYLGIGIIERDGGTLYCSLAYFNPQGEIIGVHRKLKPTGAERLIWGEGDGRGLLVLPTKFGNLGGLICWENYMPLARMALYSKGVEIYMAPTADSRQTWQATMQHIACEGRCFVLGCNQYVTRDMYPPDLQDHPELQKQPKVMCRGGSLIVSPLGDILAGPLFDQEGILYADLDMDDIVRAKVDFDVVGHYARPDVFEFKINEKRG